MILVCIICAVFGIWIAVIYDGRTVMRAPKKPVAPFVMPGEDELEELLYTPPRMWENTPSLKKGSSL